MLVVGLGNPGKNRARNRHNIGFMSVDAIARRHGFPAFRSKFEGEVADGEIGGRRVTLLKPMTYMNESGRSVAQAVRFYRLAPAEVVVFHDEIDLAAAKVRVKRGGGHAGHNGLRSLHAHIGPDYARVRLGIGRPEHKDEVLTHVLKDFAKDDAPWLEKLIAAVAEHVPLLLADDDGAFMSKVVHAVVGLRPRKARAPKPEAEDQPKEDPERGL
ncbi:MAG: aminoacyl-tRNA hydrolase [Rhodospirillales bacterium]|nr:aminoacyl-tRNA hydrolase [Rhodospirillales bacterium]